MKRILPVILFVVAIILIAPTSIAQAQGPEAPAPVVEIPQTLGEFFTWLGTATAFGVVMSLVLEKLPFWAGLNSGLKAVSTMLLAVGLGLLSHALVTYVPAGVVADAQPWYQAIVSGISIWLASQGFHSAVNQREKYTAHSTTPDAPYSGPVSGLSDGGGVA